MTGDYVSLYGFGPVTNAVLDCVAERHGLEAEELAARLDRLIPDFYASSDSVLTTTMRRWIEDESWDQVLGPAVDEFDKRLFPQEER